MDVASSEFLVDGKYDLNFKVKYQELMDTFPFFPFTIFLIVFCFSHHFGIATNRTRIMTEAKGSLANNWVTSTRN